MKLKSKCNDVHIITNSVKMSVFPPQKNLKGIAPDFKVKPFSQANNYTRQSIKSLQIFHLFSKGILKLNKYK